MFEDISLDYRAARALQICIMFVASLALQRWFAFAHAPWIGFSVMMINAGFDSGTTLHRTQHRFWGAMLGLLFSFLLWLLIRIHYEFIFLIIPVVVFMAFFVMGKLYSAPTIFTVALTALGTIYYNSSTYHPSEFFFDYGRSTLIALAICVFFEFFVFKQWRLTHRFYGDMQQTLVRELDGLFQLVITCPVRESQYLKTCAHLNTSVVAFNAFFSALKHDYHTREEHFKDFGVFSKLVEDTYQNIRQLFVLKNEKKENLIQETEALLAHLFQICSEHHV